MPSSKPPSTLYCTVTVTVCFCFCSCILCAVMFSLLLFLFFVALCCHTLFFYPFYHHTLSPAFVLVVKRRRGALLLFFSLWKPSLHYCTYNIYRNGEKIMMFSDVSFFLFLFLLCRTIYWMWLFSLSSSSYGWSLSVSLSFNVSLNILPPFPYHSPLSLTLLTMVHCILLCALRTACEFVCMHAQTAELRLNAMHA